MIARVVLAAVVALSAIGCKAFTPIGSLQDVPVRADWVKELYALETFAFKPVERGAPIWLNTAATPRSGLVVVPSRDRHIRGINAASGEILWSFATQGPNVARALPVGEDLLVGSVDGHLYRLHQRNGRAIWKAPFPGKTGITSEVARDAKRVFATSIGDRIAAFDLKTGKLLWNRQRSSSGEFTVTGQAGALVDGDRVITGFSDGWLVGYSIEDGATVWSVDLSGGKDSFVDVDTTPIKMGKLYIAGSYATGLFGIDRKSGAIRWRIKNEGFRTPARTGSFLYAPTGDGSLLALDGRTGRVIWRKKLGNRTPGTPAVTRRYLLVPIGESLLVLDRKTGAIISHVGDSLGFSAAPFYIHGVLFAQANSGLLYALGVY